MSYVLCKDSNSASNEHYVARLEWEKLTFYVSGRDRVEQITELAKIKAVIQRMLLGLIPPPKLTVKAVVTEWQEVVSQDYKEEKV